jgi:hypothetical protein
MFPDSYKLKWKLTDGENVWTEVHDDISLTDFETIYGNNTYHILEVSLNLIVRVVLL